jgi:hypothetical protein
MARKTSKSSGASPSQPTPRASKSKRTVPRAAVSNLPQMNKKPPFEGLGVPGPTKKTRRLA